MWVFKPISACNDIGFSVPGYICNAYSSAIKSGVMICLVNRMPAKGLAGCCATKLSTGKCDKAKNKMDEV